MRSGEPRDACRRKSGLSLTVRTGSALARDAVEYALHASLRDRGPLEDPSTAGGLSCAFVGTAVCRAWFGMAGGTGSLPCKAKWMASTTSVHRAASIWPGAALDALDSVPICRDVLLSGTGRASSAAAAAPSLFAQIGARHCL